MRVRVGGDGLIVRRWRRITVVPWAEVFFIDWRRRRCWVVTAQGAFSVDRATAEAIERQIAPWEAERDAWVESLPAEHRAGWLGLRPGEQWVGRSSAADRRRQSPWLGVSAFALLASLPYLTLLPAVVWGPLVATAALGLAHALLGTRARADASGVRSAPWAHFQWSDIRSLTADRADLQGEMLTVWTRRGRWSWPVAHEGLADLRQAVERCCAERLAAVPAPERAGRAAAPTGLARTWLWLDEERLWLLTPGRAVSWPLGRMPYFEWRPHRARLAIPPVAFWQLHGGNALADELARRLGRDQPQPAEAAALPPEVIEEWLGVPPGGSLVCRVDPRRHPWVLVGAALYILCQVMEAISIGWLFAISQMSVLLAVCGPAYLLLRGAREVQADGRGLSVRFRGRRECYAWSEVTGIAPGRHGSAITTTRGTVSLSTHALEYDRLVSVVQHVLAARHAGRALPDDQPVPESALSRLTGDEGASAERGLSVSREDGNSGHHSTQTRV